MTCMETTPSSSAALAPWIERHAFCESGYINRPETEVSHASLRLGVVPVYGGDHLRRSRQFTSAPAKTCAQSHADHFCLCGRSLERSEERRVGKECRCGWVREK